MSIDLAIRYVVESFCTRRRASFRAPVRFLVDRADSGWWILLNTGDPDRESLRFARSFLSLEDVERASNEGGEKLLELVRRTTSCAFSQLFPPKVPFRIGTRHAKRLRSEPYHFAKPRLAR